MDKPIFICFPAMHKELAPQNMPEELRFMEPGLAMDASAAKNSFTLPGLPFSPKEAGRVMSELLEMGLNIGRGGDLKLFAAASSMENNGREAEEKRALLRFASGEEPEEPAETGGFTPDEALKNAQKTLLLAWDLEEKILEISRLEKRFADVSISLHEALGEMPDENSILENDEAQEAAANLLAALFETDTGQLRVKNDELPPGYGVSSPDWRTVLNAAAPFLPMESVLVSADTELAACLKDLAALREPEGELAGICGNWQAPETLDEGRTARPLYASLPLWKLLGHRKETPGIPWSGQEIKFLIW